MELLTLPDKSGEEALHEQTLLNSDASDMSDFAVRTSGIKADKGVFAPVIYGIIEKIGYFKARLIKPQSPHIPMNRGFLGVEAIEINHNENQIITLPLGVGDDLIRICIVEI